MKVLDQLASSLNFRGDKPNKELACKISENKDHAGIAELVELLQHKNKKIQSDSIKTLYEIAYLNPELVAPYYTTFLDLLKSKNNRMVWGAMCALDKIALVKPHELYQALPQVLTAAEKGTVITTDRAVKLLVKLAQHKEYEHTVAILLEFVERAPINQLPTYAEATASVLFPEYKEQFINIVQLRLQEVDYEAKRKNLLKTLKKVKAIPRG